MTLLNRVPLKNSEHALPAGSVAMQKTRDNAWLELTLGVIRRQDLPDLSDLDMEKPADRKYLTRDELVEQYGSNPDSVARIKAFAAAHSLVVTREEPGAARLGLAGTVKDLSTAFGVTLFDYNHPTLGAFHARTGPISVPEEIAGDITGVFGFNNHKVMHRGKNHLPRTAANATARSRSWFNPNELADIYAFPKTDASKQCLALFEFGGGVETSTLPGYFKMLGLANPTVEIVALDNVSTDPASDPDTTGEVMLDICVAGAVSGGAKIAVYFSTFDEKGMVDAIAAVITDKEKYDPSVVSISYGWDENQRFNNSVLWSPAAIDHVNHSFLAASKLGITVCVSTGDDGSEAQVTDGRAHVNFPASSPYVLAVGGTTLHAGKGSGGITVASETVWNGGPRDGATGGGVSDYIAAPSWQSNVKPISINPGHFAGRGIPDVAANADPATGYLVVTGGQNIVVGGTSASAPLWASLIAQINAALGHRVGNFNALLYTKIGPSGVLRDVTVGNNDITKHLDGQYAAKKGWDCCTGWGTPDGNNLLAALK